jgi:hypothetical protein
MPPPLRDVDDGDVTDDSGFLRSERGWKAVLAAALAVLVAGVGVLVSRTGNPATADTYVSFARQAVVVFADGASRPAERGVRVPASAQLKTGAGGSAVLSTAGRDVYRGALSTLAVVDGVRQDLRKGQAMVDSRNGPRLALTTPAGVVAVPDGGLVRVEEGVLLRVGAFEGTAHLTAADRKAGIDVPALHQSKAAYGGIGQAPTPLALTDDGWERRLAANLVSADLDLRALARGLAGNDGQLVLQAASASLRAVPPASVDRGEQALAVAVAQASAVPDQVRTLRTVQEYRAAGGSWGVVAALVAARVSAVSALLDGVLAAPGDGTPVQAGSSTDLGNLLGGGPGGPTSGPTRSTAPRPTTSPSRGSGGGGGGGQSQSPSPVDQLVGTVTGLLTPTPSPPATSPTPSPTPILQIGPIRIG